MLDIINAKLQYVSSVFIKHFITHLAATARSSVAFVSSDGSFAIRIINREANYAELIARSNK